MALLRILRVNGRFGNLTKTFSASVHDDAVTKGEETTSEVETMEDMPIMMENPFEKARRKCLLCEHEIEPDYKNVRLLSQFVSRFTGRVYGKHITGLCDYQQKKVEEEIKKAQRAGLMGYYVKNPNYLADPVLFDVEQKFRFI